MKYLNLCLLLVLTLGQLDDIVQAAKTHLPESAVVKFQTQNENFHAGDNLDVSTSNQYKGEDGDVSPSGVTPTSVPLLILKQNT